MVRTVRTGGITGESKDDEASIVDEGQS